MAWNEPGGNGNKDPWGGKRGGDGPPDLDEALKKFQEKLNGLFGGGNNSGNAGKSTNFPFSLVLVVLVLVYLAMGVYQVNTQQSAVILRLGVFNQIKGEGLHWNPWLIDSVTKVNVTKIRNYSTTNMMLTEDLNIVEATLSVQWIIGSVKDFVLEVREPERSLAEATDSALRHAVGASEMHQVLTEGRESLAIEVQARLQEYLDSYNTGIQIVKVNVEQTQPPREVQAAFDDVNKAREDEERVKNEAQTYANGVIPEARGHAQRVIEEANGYKAEVVARAEGETKRFTDLLVEYEKAPRVTRERLYLDAIQQVMTNSSKVLVDVEGGNNMMYLPLDKIMEQSQTTTTSLRGGSSAQMVEEVKQKVLDQLRREVITTSRGGVR